MVRRTEKGKEGKGKESCKTSNKQMKKSALTLKFSRNLFESQVVIYRSVKLQQVLKVEFPKEADSTIGVLSGGTLGMNTQEKMAGKELKQNWVERS